MRQVGRFTVRRAFHPVREEDLHVIGYLRMEPRDYMAIRVESQSDRAMPEHLLHDFGVNAAFKELGCRGVTKVVDSELG